MTVNTDLFVGSLPPRCEGVVVRLTGENIDNAPHRPEFYIEFSFKHTDRRTVMSKVFSLAKKLPCWNLEGTLDGGTVKFAQVLKNHLEVVTIADEGRIKYLALLEMSVMI